jgi:hypothetical protein
MMHGPMKVKIFYHIEFQVEPLTGASSASVSQVRMPIIVLSFEDR